MSRLAPIGRGSAGSDRQVEDRVTRPVSKGTTTAGITMREPVEASDCSPLIEQLESEQQEEEPSCAI